MFHHVYSKRARTITVADVRGDTTATGHARITGPPVQSAIAKQAAYHHPVTSDAQPPTGGLRASLIVHVPSVKEVRILRIQADVNPLVTIVLESH